MASHGLNTPKFHHMGDGLIHVAVKECRMQGRVEHGVAHFLGVPYASIPARFSWAQVLDQFESSGFHEATNYGPRCPQPVDVLRTQRQHFYEGIQQSDSLSTSEFECLAVISDIMTFGAGCSSVRSSLWLKLPNVTSVCASRNNRDIGSSLSPSSPV